jgi:ABC-type Fe3+ transport system permease subunit
VVGLEVFAAAVSAVSIIALLGTGANQPLSILQLVYLDSGRFEPAAVVGMIITTITIAAAMLARVVSFRTGLARYGR